MEEAKPVKGFLQKTQIGKSKKYYTSGFMAFNTCYEKAGEKSGCKTVNCPALFISPEDKDYMYCKFKDLYLEEIEFPCKAVRINPKNKERYLHPDILEQISAKLEASHYPNH